ncbi:MAG: FAD-binding oxidoreductase [Myxococcales bacterium]|nr:FAD-binding oxidoreductase [Myxococcales bacterium]MCB9731049.1 FAD-binding oxidoreductase [Deltaproteobacteria bacterium]
MSATPPRLKDAHAVTADVRALLKTLPRAGFRGDVHADAATRLVAGTDNSVYQIVPEAVVYPRDHDDVVTLFRVASEPRFARVALTPRGGGTGTNAQALTSGVVVDVSRYMNRILEVDLARGVARVEPGVVLDQLNEVLAPSGVFFAPNLSPSTRATIGGMVATDASGQGSRVYGKTSQHVEAVRCVFVDGTEWRTAPLDAAGLAEVAAREDIVGRIHREVALIVRESRDAIERDWPRLERFLTGYNLAMVHGRVPGAGGEGEDDGAAEVFDLKWLITGSEGTLAAVTEVTVRLTPIPTARRLVVLKYGAFDDALAAARELVAADPGSIETIDETVLALVRKDILYDAVKDYLTDEPGRAPTRTINLVEFEGGDAAALDAKVKALTAGIAKAAAAKKEGAATGFHVAPDEAARKALWELRKKGVGLLGATEGRRKPVPFVEDTVVPPERLAAYVRQFRAILDREGVTYGMFGHVDVGCLHVRPALDLRDPEDEARLRRISDEVAALCLEHGGLIWGEHGKGVRSEYNPRFFGERLFAACCEVKAAFDPDNRLNPGKIATPPARRGELATIDAPTRGQRDRHIGAPSQARYEVALACNGNGACYHYDPHYVMCPSSKVTRDRVHSPKGRAGVFREWLRRGREAGFEATAGGPWKATKSALWWPVRALRTLGRRLGRYDYSHEVADAMAGCLACKACATQCPVKVDVPAFRADFMEVYHRRYLRPLKHHFVAGLESVLLWLARGRGLARFALKSRLSRWFMRWVVGIVDVPALPEERLTDGLRERGLTPVPLAQLARAGALPENAVIVLQDAFTTFYEPHVVLAVVDLLRALGKDPIIGGWFPNGKALHVVGFLERFERLVRKNAAELDALAGLERPVVGIEPAIALTYRDEYPHVLGRPLAVRVQLLQEYLATAMKKSVEVARDGSGEPVKLFLHCTEKTLLSRSDKLWRAAFEAAGVRAEVVSAGCCGMSGFYGHDRDHVAESRGIYEMSWQKRLPAPEKRGGMAVTGYSCRSQLHRFEGVAARHPAELLLAAVAQRRNREAGPVVPGEGAATGNDGGAGRAERMAR